MSMLGLRDLLLIAPTPSSLQHQHHHHHHHHQQQGQPISGDNHNNNTSSSNLPLPSLGSLSVGFGIFPLLTATPCVPPQQQNNNEVHQDQCVTNNNYWNLKMCPPEKEDIHESHRVVMMAAESGGDLENGAYGGCEGDFRVCQDCGNRAKKDCVYRRCRTCCKGRGYDCNTHVKSTWVPAVRRRERQMVMGSGSTGGCSGGDSPGPKRPRALGSSQNAAATSHSSNSNATTPKSLDTSSCHQDAGFKQSLPRHVRAPAVFRCHRVSAIGNGENEFAYLATVHISGHVFKGFLYDHGVKEGKNNAMPCASELQLGNSCSGKNKECSSSIGVPTNNVYSAAAT